MVAAGGDLFKGGREVAVFVEIANDRDCSVLDLVFDDGEVQLPLQVVAQRGCLCQEALEPRSFDVLAGHLRAISRIEIVVEVAAIVDLFERIGWLAIDGLVHRDDLFVRRFSAAFLFGARLFQRGCGFRHLLEDGILHQLLRDHFGELELVQRQNADHLDQAGGQNLFLRELDVETLFQKSHGSLFQSKALSEVELLHFFDRLPVPWVFPSEKFGLR